MLSQSQLVTSCIDRQTKWQATCGDRTQIEPTYIMSKIFRLEVGYLAFKNMWLAVGYNVKGFSAPDLAGEAYTRRGLYARMRFKFDENVFNVSDASGGLNTKATVPQ